MIKKKILYEEHAPRAKFVMDKKWAVGKTYQTNCAAGRIF